MNNFQFLMYTSAEEDISVNAVIKDETIWLSQKAMAELFGVNIPAISKHLQNIYLEHELSPDTTISKMEIVQKEGSRSVKRAIDYYNLDAIISVGYRANSHRATQFCIWSTKDIFYRQTKNIPHYSNGSEGCLAFTIFINDIVRAGKS